MKKSWLYLFLPGMISVSGCKKDNPFAPAANNNEVIAQVLLSSGTTVNIQAKGSKARMAPYTFLGGPGYIQGTNDATNMVIINLYPSISQTGSFGIAQGFSCQYRPDGVSGSSPIYLNSGANSGQLVITSFSDHYIAGNYSAVCRYGTDSVTVTGTFRGDKFNY